jgi:hypothetical protein
MKTYTDGRIGPLASASVPEDGGSIFLLNIGTHLPDYMVS